MNLIGFKPLCVDLDGFEANILSPWSDHDNPLSCDRLMEGGWLYLGSFADDNILYIDFVSINGFDEIARWRVDQAGKYLDQSRFSSARIGLSERYPNYTHTNTPQNLALYARGKSNDLQIYLAIRYLLRDADAAAAVMNAHRPDQDSAYHPARIAPDSTNINLIVIFNHNYARNIPRLDAIYSGRFTSATYILPNVAPDSPRCLSFPVGSYSYHTLIFHGIDNLLKRGAVDENAWYFFTQDDVYLNKNFSQNNVSRFFTPTKEYSSFYYDNPLTRKWSYSSDWSWSTRVLNSLEKQRHPTYGNGFEGFKPLMQNDVLSKGVGDLFAIRGACLHEFSVILGNYIGQNIFPEVSIPSTLRNLAVITDTKIGLFQGEYLWGEDRKKIKPDYVQAFDSSGKLFLHPVKMAHMK